MSDNGKDNGIFKFSTTFEGTHLPERLGYLNDRRTKKMLGLFFTEKGLQVSDKLLNTCKDKFTFEKVDCGFAIENIGRIKLGDGTVVRIFFTPKGLKIMLPKKSKSIIWTKERRYYDKLNFTQKEQKWPTIQKTK